ncbi:MAG: lipoprotein [Sulfuricurvum sp. PC08-66]|nr:MAG: lipoprotein [Sulfuricurvum sp. PC08-66]
MRYTSFIALIFALLLSGCDTMQLEDFAQTTPTFVPQKVLDGRMTAYGLVKDYNGNIIRTFKGHLVGSWDSTTGEGELKEYFLYSDGEEERRTWHITPTAQEGHYSGTADNVIGTSPIRVVGNTMMLDYTLRIPYNEGTLDIDIRDWLHLQEDGVIINHSKMKKFGITVGELVITIIKDFPLEERE